MSLLPPPAANLVPFAKSAPLRSAYAMLSANSPASPHREPTLTPDELTTRREELGLTQSELALLLGVPRLTVWKWEHANQKVPALMDMALRGVQATLEEQPRRRRRRRQPVATTTTDQA